jgi:hypothetical protein
MTKIKTTNSRIVSKKVLLPAIIAVVAGAIILTGIFVVYPAISSASAIQQTANTSAIGPGNGQLPKVTGSINVMQVTKNVIKDNLKVPFSQAADIAGKQITNGTVIGGHIGVVQGYLVYTFFAVNPGTHTRYLTVVDAGNGKVLYTSPGQQMGGDSIGTHGAFGQQGPHGLAGGFGHEPMGFGPWRAPGGFMGGRDGDGLWH